MRKYCYLDENRKKGLSASETAEKVKQNVNSIYRSVKKYAVERTEAMVYRKGRTDVSPLLKVTGEVEAHISDSVQRSAGRQNKLDNAANSR